IAEVLQSTTRFVANQAAYADEWKRSKIDNLALMLKSCLAAEGKVGLMMNVRRADLARVLEQLPALQKPTVSSLSDPDWVDVNTTVEEASVRVIVPKLKGAGARGIVEYQINKIIDCFPAGVPAAGVPALAGERLSASAAPAACGPPEGGTPASLGFDRA